MVIVKPEQLRKVCLSLTANRAAILSDIINRKVVEYKVKSFDELHEFIGQVAHESGEFAAKTENMSYSAKRMVDVWPKRFPTIAAATPYARNPVKLANHTYGGRMGNTEPNDGWLYRGGGFIGITGKSMYALFAKYKKMDVAKCADWVRSTDEGAMDSAFWFFYVFKKLTKLAIDDNDIGLSLAVNGGKIGLKNRIFYSDRSRIYLS